MKTLYSLLLFFPTILFAQEDITQTIRGKVIDKQSQYELPGAVVKVLSTNPVKAGVTDIYGEFRIENVPIGRHQISIEMEGYNTVTLNNLMLVSGKELEVNVQMEESTELEEVVIKGGDDKRKSNNKMATVSSRTLSIEEAGRYSGSLQDPARMAQNFAGVSGASDDRNDIIIRGNSPTGVLWRMEGIDIPSPNHFSTVGTTGGPISMLNINNLSNSDFMTSAFSADYGNALAGVFDLQLRNGNHDKREYLGQIGFNGFEFGAEGPFVKGKRASYLINYRYSTLGVFKALGIDFGTGAAVPEYQDVTFKLNFPTEKAGRFTFFGLGGMSYIQFLAEEADEANLFSGENENARFNSNTGIVGASHTYFFNPNTFYKIVLSASGTQTEGYTDSVSTANGEDITRIFGLDRSNVKYGYNLKLNRKINAKNTLIFGTMGDYYLINYLDSNRNDNGSYRVQADFKGDATLVQNYVLWQHKFSDKVTLNSGVHSQHFLLSKSHSVEPRLGLKYQISGKHSVSLGSGMHSQLQPMPVYFVNENGELPNQKLDFTKAIHGVLGYDFFFSENFRFKTELYYQHLYNVPVDTFASAFSMLNEGADFVITNKTGLINEGTGKNYGIEFTLERFLDKGFYFLTTLSLFESKYTGSDGIERNTIFNGNYVANGLAGKEFKLGKKSILSLDTRITYAGGRRFTPINLEASRYYGFEVREESQYLADQYRPYFRWDFKVSYRRNGKNISQVWSLDIQNVSNHFNVFQYGYNRFTEQIVSTPQRGFFPVVLYKIYF